MKARFTPVVVLIALVVSAVVGVARAGEAPEHSLEAITKRLATTRLDVKAEKQEPEAVLDLIRDAAKVNIVIAPDARHQIEGKTVTLKLTGISAISALGHVLRQCEMVTSYGDEALIVTTPGSAQPHPQVTVYDIRDITETARGTRLPPQLFGSQIDPLYYYWVRNQLGPTTTDGARDPFGDLELVDKYPPDHIGEVIAKTIQEKVGEQTGVSVSYHDGYLVVVEKPKAARVPVLPPTPTTPTK